MFEPLPALIRLQREAQGLTIDALSALSGVSRTRLIALERGNDNISLELLVKVANALQMTELRIGGLRVVAAEPNFTEAAAVADAMETTRRILDQARDAREELDRVAGPVAEILAPVIKPAQRVGNDAGPETRARRTAGRR